MRGVLSEGMIMCASNKPQFETIEVPNDATIGDRIVCEGYTGIRSLLFNKKCLDLIISKKMQKASAFFINFPLL